MSVQPRLVKQQIEVERKATAWTCDGPTCEHEHIGDTAHGIPVGWYGLYTRDETAERHFCCLRCMVDYALYHLETQEKTPAHAEEAAHVAKATLNAVSAAIPAGWSYTAREAR